MSAAAPTEGKRKKTPRTAMPEQPPRVRVTNFEEVALGYTREMAMIEAGRCLACKKPACVAGCPVGIDIPGFIAALRAGDTGGAYAVIRKTNSLPAVCGRVCPQESQCESRCILGKKGEPVAIGRLERFVADTFMADDACEELTGAPACPPGLEDTRVACIGAGPSSLTVAGTLAAKGIGVDVYEALHEPGGVLVYGIPEFRLPKAVVRREVEAMQGLGVRFYTNWVGGRTIGIDELLERGYKAVFLGVGAGLPVFLGIPGENAIGVCSANEYLTRVNLGRAYAFPEWDTPVHPGKQVVVFGAGNVALDSARTARRMGAERVAIVYRRTENEMPARREELHHAKEEGVELFCLHSPLSFNSDGNGRLVSVVLQKMRLGEPDDSGRCRPLACEGEYCELPADMAIVAVGTRANPLLPRVTPGLAANTRGYIVIDEETGETSIPNVFAGGDIVTGAATVISAMGAGRRAAAAIADRLM
ncbi:glutamate synthase (NADPH), homotetrameric [Solidesulfovibrio fructosivorans JJ]]|uniref:Glutamate synthase (NADPH), homotetrameric n=1 Tax=Solidesulfovibrio fructosivorans JJ] TaxID=596151 RepID=E1JWB1_SOLFR|nr:NADPH-dependent glutamate synthase [Solidesulfovibrio fructosivorans]EFL51471.1 glutamate synthase (NADPH), homotetrameric [Solidesulfovibrio fructosivorans JJ]]